MKKHLLLSALISFAAVAQDSDPVAEQIRLTQDAVSIAVSEVENNAQSQSATSEDGDLKLAADNLKIKEALRLFEERVRLRILVPMQILVGQYNRTYSNDRLPRDEKAASLELILAQLTEMAKSRELDYFREIARLHSPLGAFPVTGKIVRRSGDLRLNSVLNASEQVLADNLNYYARWEQTRRTNGNSQNDFTRLQESYHARDYVDSYGLSLTREIARDCYTNICFFQSLNQAMMWANLIRTSLSRDILIRLADGKTLSIKGQFGIKDANDHWEELRFNMASAFLRQVPVTELVLGLPSEIRSDRIASLKRLESALNIANYKERDCKRAVRTIKDNLCRSNGGCLSSAEQALVVDRLVASTRAACLN